MLNMEVNGMRIQIELCDNSSARAVEGLLKDGPLAIDMMDYAHMEKFGRLKQNLPTNDEYMTTKAGGCDSLRRESAGALLRAQYLDFHPTGICEKICRSRS